jgi:hypothetical protein
MYPPHSEEDNMSQVIPISATPNQTLNVVLNNQNCQINLSARDGYVYLDLFVNNVNIIYGRKLSLTPVLSYLYLQAEFVGNLMIINDDGNTDVNPDYTLFGITQSLLYYTQADVA